MWDGLLRCGSCADVTFDIPEDYLSIDDWAQSKSSRLTFPAVSLLKGWFSDPSHWVNPYPTEQEKAELAIQTGLNVTQVCLVLTYHNCIFRVQSHVFCLQISNWLRNERKRVWLPLKRKAINQAVLDMAKAKKLQMAANEAGDASGDVGDS
jgi:hypothetical protein